jgi:hypothetical protein
MTESSAEHRKAQELESAFREGFDMPGYYSTGAAWMNSDIRPLYFRGETATYMILQAGQEPRMARTRPERLPGRAIKPGEAYAAFEEGHLRGREFRGFGTAARERAADDAWQASGAYAAAHPGAALVRELHQAVRADQAREQLLTLSPRLVRLENVVKDLTRVGNEQRNAARVLTTTLAGVYEDTDPIRARLRDNGPAPAEEILRSLRESPSELGALRPDVSPAHLQAAIAAAEAVVTARRSTATARDEAEALVQSHRTAPSYTTMQVAERARGTLSSEVQRLEEIAGSSPKTSELDAFYRWFNLSDEERALARAAAPNVEQLVTEAGTGALAVELHQRRRHAKINAEIGHNARLIDSANGVFHAAREVRGSMDQIWKDTQDVVRPRFERHEEILQAIQGMDPREIRALADALRLNPRTPLPLQAAAETPSVSAGSTPDRAAGLKPVPESGWRGFVGQISQSATEREARVAAVALEAWASMRERATLTAEWAAPQVGLAADAQLERIQEVAAGRYGALLEANQKLIEARGHLPPESHLDQVIRRRMEGLDPDTAAIVRSGFPEVDTIVQARAPRTINIAPVPSGMAI